jgi:hypothetical protein
MNIKLLFVFLVFSKAGGNRQAPVVHWNELPEIIE